MTLLTEIPNTPQTGYCDKHGEYEYQYVKIFNGKYMVRDCCGKCISEEKNAERLKEEQKIEEGRKARIRSNKSTFGVSKRNQDVTFSDFDADTERKAKTKMRMEKWLDDFYKDKHKVPSVIITGKVGTGKTMIASCIMNDLLKDAYQYPSCRLIKLIDMVRRLKETWRRDSEQTERQLIERLSSIDLLIIDEVGMGFESETEKLFVFDVIDGRYQNELPTILISNLNAEGIKESIGDRALDRLRDGGGILIGCDWESYRK